MLLEADAGFEIDPCAIFAVDGESEHAAVGLADEAVEQVLGALRE
jgi:hypothetical protein